jgi:hypothetical protein
MSKSAYKKNVSVSPLESVSRSLAKGKPKKKRNGLEKMAAMHAVTKMLKKGYGRRK